MKAGRMRASSTPLMSSTIAVRTSIPTAAAKWLHPRKTTA